MAWLHQAMAAEPGASRAEPLQEPTGLPLATLQWVGRSICGAPPGSRLHPEVQQLLQSRRCHPSATSTKAVQ